MNALVSALLNGAILSIPLTALTWIALRLTPRAVLNAATRYVVLWGVLLVSVLLPALYLPHRAPHVTSSPTAIASSSAPISTGALHAASQHTFDADADVPPSRTHSPILPITIPAGRWPIILFAVWAIAAMVMVIRLVVSWILLERRKSEGIAPPEHMARRAETWLRQCGSKRHAALRLTKAECAGPVATGPWRPQILFPARAFGDLSEMAVEQIGLHEAAHLARRDDYALTLQRLIEAMFVFHLPIRWLTNQIGLEREIACDDFVVRIAGHARDYASCLTQLAESTGGGRPVLIAAAVADEKSHLSTRVEMLLNKTRHTGAQLMKLPLCVAGLAMGLLAGAVFTGIPVLLNLVAPLPLSAQTPAPAQPPARGPGYPAYVTPGPAAPGTPGSPEPKRVRPANAPPVAPPDGGIQTTLKSTPRFTTVTITPVEWHMGGVSEVTSPAGTIEFKMTGIKRLAMLAWPSMQYFRFVWPDWLAEPNGNINAWYDIAATMPADTTPEQLQLMLQGLLVDRFQFSAHWETRDTDIYALKMAPGGIKFQKSADPSNPGYRGSGGREGWHVLPHLPNQPRPGSGMTLSQFTQDGSFPSLLGRPMVDMTGLDGVYDIDLTIPRDPDTPWPMQPLRGVATADERAKNQGFRKDVFFSEIQSQLGLVAEPQTVPMKMLVIDDIDLTPTSK